MKGQTMKKISARIKVALMALLMIGFSAVAFGGSVCVAKKMECSGADCAMQGTYATKDDNTVKSVPDTVRAIVNTIIYVLGFVAVAMIIIGGVQYTSSQGDSGKVKKAKDTILYGIIGLVVAILAYAIVHFVLWNVFSN